MGELDGAREFTIPNDHGHPERYFPPYSLHVFGIDADTTAGLAKAARWQRVPGLWSAAAR